jgi:hypothetical protein
MHYRNLASRSKPSLLLQLIPSDAIVRQLGKPNAVRAIVIVDGNIRSWRQTNGQREERILLLDAGELARGRGVIVERVLEQR